MNDKDEESLYVYCLRVQRQVLRSNPEATSEEVLQCARKWAPEVLPVPEVELETTDRKLSEFIHELSS
jgi:hypothetical protein